MSTTRLALLQKIAKDIGLGYASGAPSATGETTTIVDTSADSPMQTDDSDAKYRNWYAYIEADSAGTPLNVGECRRVSTYAPGSQTSTTNAAFSNATTTTQSYGLYAKVPPIRWADQAGLSEYLNSALRFLYYKDLVLLTLITDGDMEASSTSNWTASNSTLSKVTTQAYVRLGKRSLRVQNSSANGYARSALVSVAENQVYHVRADVQVASGTAKLQLYDETNGAEIESVTGTQRGYRYLYFSATVPTDCLQVSVRLIGVEASADVYWDNVSLRNGAAREIALPTWLEAETAVQEVEEWRGGTVGTSEDDVAIDEGEHYSVSWFEAVRDPAGQTPYRLRYSHYCASDSLLVAEIIRRHPDLSADTDTTDADADWVAYAALSLIYEERGDEASYKRVMGRLARIGAPHQPQTRRRMMVRPY